MWRVDRVVERISNLGLVTVVTLMIWLYAEGQNLVSVTKTAIAVRLETTGDLIAEFEDPQPLRIEIEGPTRPVRLLDAQLNSQLTLKVGENGVPATPGTHRLVMIDVLRQQKLFIDAGVSIRSVDPAVMTLVVDRWQTLELEVEPAPLNEIQLEGSPTFLPPRVAVSVRESVLETTPPTQLHLVATPDVTRLRQLPEGVPQTVDARLTVQGVADQRAVRPSIASVQMTLTVKSRRETLTKTTVPIHLVMPPLDQPRYRVTVRDPFLSEVRLTGPSDVIERIRRGDLKVIGEVKLTSDHLARGVTEMPVVFDDLPDSVQVEGGPFQAQLIIERVDLPVEPDVVDESVEGDQP